MGESRRLEVVFSVPGRSFNLIIRKNIYSKSIYQWKFTRQKMIGINIVLHKLRDEMPTTATP